MAITFDPFPTGHLERHPQDGWILADPAPMSAFTLTAVHAVIRAVVPPPPAPHFPDLEERISTGVRHILPYMAPLFAKGFVIGMHALNWSPIWAFKGLRPLQMLTPEEGSAILQELAELHNPLIDKLLQLARASLLAVYYDQDEVHDALNYDPRTFMKERIALRKRMMAGETTTPSDRIGPHSEGLEP